MASIAAQLQQLDLDFEEGELTRKGYEKRRTALLASVPDGYLNGNDSGRQVEQSELLGSSDDLIAYTKSYSQELEDDLREDYTQTINYDSYADGNMYEERPLDFEFRPVEFKPDLNTNHSYMQSTERLGSSRNSFSSERLGRQFEIHAQDNLEPQDDVISPYSQFSTSDPMEAMWSTRHGPQLFPLEPRDIPFAIFDPYNSNIAMSKFDNIAAVLRHRGRTNPKKTSFLVLDSKGKELSTITWEKLSSRAEKVAQVIRDKSGLYKGDRVALVYKDNEVIEFAVALFGCFIAGVVAVPINRSEDFQELCTILTATEAHLALTTDTNLKMFQRDLSAQKLSWPRGVEWWKTNEFGNFHPKKKGELPPLQAPDLAYIEYSRSPTGDLRGVVISHRTVMHQMACLSAMVSTTPSDKKGPIYEFQGKTPSNRGTGEILVTYLDPRQAIGMILGVLKAVYHGNTTIWCPPVVISTPGLFAHIITRYKATIMLADYPGLKTAAYNYQNDPMSTRGKKHSVDFSSIKLCLVDCLTVDTEFHEILADRWLRPLGNKRAREVLTPMLCLPEHGGMVISMKDWLAGEEKIVSSGVTASHTDDDDSIATEVLLDQEALKANEIVVVAIGEEVSRRASEPSVVRVGSFWYPLADATLAIVDPETSSLCSSNTVGEIWIDSPSMSACYWLLPRHTDTIFHARPFANDAETRQPRPIEQEFLRTGLLGFVMHGRVFVLGLYEDRLRQKVEWVENGQQDVTEYRYHYVTHLVSTIMRQGLKIFDCSAFDVYINKEHLPVILIESASASTAPITPSGPSRILDNDVLNHLAEKVIEALLEHHQVRVYCVLICAPNTLPRVSRNGRKEIGNMLCRKEFERGSLPTVLIRFAVERAVLNLPVGEDPTAGIWSVAASENREAILSMEDKQYSGVDDRMVVLDERTSTNLADFGSIVEVFQWRASRQIEELALCTVDSRGKEGKGITWKKLDLKIAAVAHYLKTKMRAISGSNIVLMYTHTEDFFFAVQACFCLGLTAIPIAPLDPTRLTEDVPAFLNILSEYNVKAILTNSETHGILTSKVISQHLKQSTIALKISVPQMYNTSKPPKQTKGCRELGFAMEQNWLNRNFVALIWIYWSPDQRRTAVSLGHDTIMGMCKVHKETSQMPSSRPVLGCIRSSSGLGFLHSCLMGIYIGSPTYFLSPVDFAANPSLLVQTLARYKIKDTYTTPQTVDHLMSAVQGKVSSLHELRNLMLSFDGRSGINYYARLRTHFGPCGLDPSAINTTYGHVANPMITTRSYMCTEPTELYLDSRALREGLVHITNPSEDPFGLIIQDSGMVPISTQIAIVNPETRLLCRFGEYGEIWVRSIACAKAFYGSKDHFDAERFHGIIVDGENKLPYVRTGDLGFLYSVRKPIGSGGGMVDMQTLFVLGSIGETFDVNGLNHFPVDIENTVERCHKVITRARSAVFQAGGQVVLLVEVLRTAHLSSVVPVIVNAVLNEHQIVLDKVAFCARGDFPRSRLREKQRGKILASWVTKKLKTCVTYNIKSENIEDESVTRISTSNTRTFFPENVPIIEEVVASTEAAATAL